MLSRRHFLISALPSATILGACSTTSKQGPVISPEARAAIAQADIVSRRDERIAAIYGQLAAYNALNVSENDRRRALRNAANIYLQAEVLEEKNGLIAIVAKGGMPVEQFYHDEAAAARGTLKAAQDANPLLDIREMAKGMKNLSPDALTIILESIKDLDKQCQPRLNPNGTITLRIADCKPAPAKPAGKPASAPKPTPAR